MTTFITVDNIKTLITNHKDNLGGLNDTQIIEFCDFMNQSLYPKFVNVNPNDYLTNHIIKTVVSTSDYAQPSNLKDLRAGALLETNTGSDFGAISYDAETVAFTTIGQTITGGTSGATGTLSSIVDYGTTGTLVMTSVSGTFQDNEVLTGSTEGSATSNGTVISFKYGDEQLTESGFGSSDTGYWLDASNINFTPTPTQSKVFVLRYLPDLDTLTLTTDSTIIPIAYKEYARNAADIFWNQWRQTNNGEFEAQQRTESALNEMLKTLKKTTKIGLFPNKSGVYTKKRRRSIYAR